MESPSSSAPGNGEIRLDSQQVGSGDAPDDLPEPDQPAVEKQSKKREPREVPPLTRDPGKSLLPFSRVQKILKADKELPIVAREATFLISLATEEFIKRIAEESRIVASRENRITVQYKDVANVVRRTEKFMFLDEIVPFQPPQTNPQPRQRKSKTADDGKPRPTTMLDAFVKKNASNDDEVAALDDDIVMNEDGTMTVDPQ